MTTDGPPESDGRRASEGDEAGKLRLFVAIELPEAWKETLRRVQENAAAKLAAAPATRRLRVRWVRPEGIHLTLKFLGYVAPERLDSVCRALASAVPEPPGFGLRLGRIGSFSDRRAPRVIWAGIVYASEETIEAGRPAPFTRLVEQIETWMASAGFPRERRAVTPHLTLARLPEPLSAAERQLVAELAAVSTLPAVEPLRVEGVTLMRSHLAPGGARYEPLGRFPA